jgi:hypothetical protein
LRTVIDHVCDAEVYDLDRIVRDHEQVARFQVPVHQAVLVRGLQSATRLRDDLDDAFNREAMTRVLDQVVQSLAAQQRHDEKWLLLPVLLELPHVENFDDVGVADRLEDAAFFVEEVESEAVTELVQRLNRDLAVHGRRIVGAQDDAHAPFAEGGFDLVSALDLCHARPMSEEPGVWHSGPALGNGTACRPVAPQETGTSREQRRHPARRTRRGERSLLLRSSMGPSPHKHRASGRNPSTLELPRSADIRQDMRG